MICLVLLLTTLLGVNGSYEYRLDNGLIDVAAATAASEVAEKPSFLASFVDSLNIAVASQGFVIALFPIYSSMVREKRPRFMISVSTGLMFTFSCYTYLSLISISYFG